MSTEDLGLGCETRGWRFAGSKRILSTRTT